MRNCSVIIGALRALLLVTFGLPVRGEDAPNAPGVRSVWAPARKDFLGTSASPTSRVYFTGAEGILTEIFYPVLDQVQNVDMQLLVRDHAGTFEARDAEERRQPTTEVSLVNKRALVWKVVTTGANGKWRTTKKFFCDPSHNSVIERVLFETLEPGKSVSDYDVYLLNNPAINNSGGGQNSGGNDNSRTLSAGGRTFLAASEPGSTSSVIGVSLPWKQNAGEPMVSNGFVGTNDGFTDLFGGANDKRMDWRFSAAFGGNVAQIGWIDFGGSTGTGIAFDIVLAFGNNEAVAANEANATLSSDLDALEKTYTSQWETYNGSLKNLNATADDQYYLAAMCLKTAQDKSNGAMIAALGTPWGETNDDRNSGGYHLVWSRDLFKFASALLAAGDIIAATEAVDFLFNIQMQTVDSDEGAFSRRGRFPQNSQVSGQPYFKSTQMDEASMPIILAWRLHELGKLPNLNTLWPKIKMAAEFVSHEGPRTDQERWEEMGGYSPSTIAAEIAGLVCAGALAEAVGDAGAAAFYRQKADEWRNSVRDWTFTTNGFHGNGKYYIRITENQNANDDVSLVLGNGVGSHGERYIIDGGFLELVRMGVLSPSDWSILETLPEYDGILKQTIPAKGDAFFRYNYDGYGENNGGQDFDGRTGRGRLWPIFTAERGIYEISRSREGIKGKPYLDALKKFASPAGLIPEQVFNITATITGWPTDTPAPFAPGEATKSIRPLNWAMGEYINLLVAMDAGRGDAPTVVTGRYSTDKPQTILTFETRAETVFGEEVYLVGESPLLGAWIPQSAVKMSTTAATYPHWTVTLSLPANTSLNYRYVKRKGDQVLWEGGTSPRTIATGVENANATLIDTFQ